MSLKIGNRSVLTSGSIVLGRTATLTIDVPQLGKILLQFVSAAEQPANQIIAKVDGDQLVVTLTNWNNPLGTAIETQIGTLNDLPIVFGVFVHAVGSSDPLRLVQYTVSNGQMT